MSAHSLNELGQCFRVRVNASPEPVRLSGSTDRRKATFRRVAEVDHPWHSDRFEGVAFVLRGGVPMVTPCRYTESVRMTLSPLASVDGCVPSPELLEAVAGFFYGCGFVFSCVRVLVFMRFCACAITGCHDQKKARILKIKARSKEIFNPSQKQI